MRLIDDYEVKAEAYLYWILKMLDDGVTQKVIAQVYGLQGYNIGKNTAEKLLEDVKHSKIEMKKRVIEVYKLTYGDTWKDALTLTGKLVYITKERGKVFDLDLFMKGVIND